MSFFGFSPIFRGFSQVVLLFLGHFQTLFDILSWFSVSTIRNSEKGHWKRSICIELSDIVFQICDTYATISRTLIYETEYTQFSAAFAAQSATNLRNAPLPDAPFLKFLRLAVGFVILFQFFFLIFGDFPICPLSWLVQGRFLDTIKDFVDA